MTPEELLLRLFRLAIELAEKEAVSGFARITEVKGIHSWCFLEHLSELPEEGRLALLRALIKRRFLLEGLQSDETVLSATEKLEINNWLKHNNSIHGTRVAPFFAFSVCEETFKRKGTALTLATEKDIRSSLRECLVSAKTPTRILRDARGEISWCAEKGTISIHGSLDLGAGRGEATSYVVVREKNRPLHVPISLLRLLGIGETRWTFLEAGEEKLCASATIQFFQEVCTGIDPRGEG